MVNCLLALRMVPSTPVQRRVLVPVRFSLIGLPLRLVVIVSATLRVSPALVVVPFALVDTPRS